MQPVNQTGRRGAATPRRPSATPIQPSGGMTVRSMINPRDFVAHPVPVSGPQDRMDRLASITAEQMAFALTFPGRIRPRDLRRDPGRRRTLLQRPVRPQRGRAQVRRVRRPYRYLPQAWLDLAALPRR